MNQEKTPRPWINLPPWLILGAVVILAPIFVFMTLEYLDRQKRNATELLIEKGAALIRSFEAGARTGMMGMNWGGFQVQRLLVETARQPDIIYLMVTDTHGNILAHSDLNKVGGIYGQDLDLEKVSKSRKENWREVIGPQGAKIFEVYREFAPIRRPFGRRGRMRTWKGNDWCRPFFDPKRNIATSHQVIFVGLDMSTVEAARKEDARHMVIMALTLLLIGFAGIVSLFLAQAYRSTKISLSRVKAFSDNLVENMPIGLVATDTNDMVISFNQAAEKILHTSSSQVLGRKLSAALPPELTQVIKKAKDSPEPVDVELSVTIREGKTVPVEVTATLLRYEKGLLLGYVALLRDLTQIRHLEEEVVRSQRLASIGRLAAGVAHEIRNPLSSIKGFATYFKERYKDVPGDKETADIMIQEVDRLNRVISQLLEFASPTRIQKSPVKIVPLIQESVKLIESDAKRKGIILKLNIEEEDPIIPADPDKLKQVLLNLYLNAIEAMDKGGKLIIRVGTDFNKNSMFIKISDTGHGIKHEDLPHIFDPYFTTKSSGTGLGLAIAHKIIESHGGEIRVISNHRQGTEVTIFLPLNPSMKDQEGPKNV